MDKINMHFIMPSDSNY